MDEPEEAWPATVLNFYFSCDPLIWFDSPVAFDITVTRLFLPLYCQLVRDETELTRRESRGRSSQACLAAIIVLDQCSRNMFRTTTPEKVFLEALPLAIELTKYAVEQGWTGNGEEEREGDEEEFGREGRELARLHPFARTCLLLPLLHSECLQDQAQAIAVMEQLHLSILPFAYVQRDCLRKFGRFPHRNKALQRTNTAEEETYLRQHPVPIDFLGGVQCDCCMIQATSR